MHDIRAIRDEPQRFIDGWTSRGVEGAEGLVAEILALDAKLRAAQTAGQEALAERNAASKAIGAAMGRKDMAEADRLKAEAEGLKGEIAAQEVVEAEAGKALRDLLAAQKNLAADDVPDGEDEAGNVEVGTWGEPRRTGPAKDHADLGEALGLLDFEAAAKMSGARFAVLKGQLARLERAIGQFMLDLQTGEHGYLEVAPPYLVRDEAMFGTGQLPKFKDDLFRIGTDWDEVAELLSRHPNALQATDFPDAPSDLEFKMAIGRFASERRWLIPTAEVSLTNLVREQILPEDDIATPMRLTALTPCFRAEAGSAGRDTR
ncbi:MAG: serine--tRNA ligase, partial [Brevundimonas sp.]